MNKDCMNMSEVRWIDSCPSANDILKKLAENGTPPYTAVAAREHSRGCGMQNRNWILPLDKSLYVSLLLNPGRPDVSLLPIIGGFACREAIFRYCRFSISLKRPTDLIRKRKKLGGLILEQQNSRKVLFSARIINFSREDNHAAGD